jgi:hypothetical protein
MFFNCSETPVLSWDKSLKVTIDMQYGQMVDVMTKEASALEIFDRIMLSLDACANSPSEDVVYVPKSLAVADELTGMLKQSNIKVIHSLPSRLDNVVKLTVITATVIALFVLCFVDCWKQAFQWQTVIVSDIIPALLFGAIIGYVVSYYRYHKKNPNFNKKDKGKKK